MRWVLWWLALPCESWWGGPGLLWIAQPTVGAASLIRSFSSAAPASRADCYARNLFSLSCNYDVTPQVDTGTVDHDRSHRLVVGL